MGSWTVDQPGQVTIEEPVERLDVNLISGRINIVADDGPTRVEVTRVGSEPLVVEVDGGRMRIGLRNRPRWPGLAWWLGQIGRRYRADVSIAISSRVAVDVQLISGAVVASGLRENTRVGLTSGRVTLMGLGGRTAAKLVSGPVEALGVAGELTLETVSGELILADSVAQRVFAKTVSGSITCDLDNPRDSEIRLGTTSGAVTVRIREDSDLAVDLHTRSGEITSAFSGVRGRNRHGPNTSQGLIGAGTGKLWAETVSGSIALLARPVEEER
jgi:hypothetical protein